MLYNLYVSSNWVDGSRIDFVVYSAIIHIVNKLMKRLIDGII